jgi:hypothetical protein|tara:strand:+ start:11996 stop:12244 length:249 start_codon:yes stop_codon:yes gene_type:complete
MAPIGAYASVRLADVNVLVQILDTKRSYGDERYQVRPIAGSRSQWVMAYRVRIVTEIVVRGVLEAQIRMLDSPVEKFPKVEA